MNQISSVSRDFRIEAKLVQNAAKIGQNSSRNYWIVTKDRLTESSLNFIRGMIQCVKNIIQSVKNIFSSKQTSIIRTEIKEPSFSPLPLEEILAEEKLDEEKSNPQVLKKSEASKPPEKSSAISGSSLPEKELPSKATTQASQKKSALKTYLLVGSLAFAGIAATLYFRSPMTVNESVNCPKPLNPPDCPVCPICQIPTVKCEEDLTKKVQTAARVEVSGDDNIEDENDLEFSELTRNEWGQLCGIVLLVSGTACSIAGYYEEIIGKIRKVCCFK